MRSIIKIIIVVVFAVSQINYGQDISKSGTTAAQFLKINVGPRAIGMGSAFTATANDISAIYWNPAGLANDHSSNAYFNHTSWIADVDLEFAALSSYIDGFGTIGAFVSVAKTIDGEIVRTIDQPEGTGELFDAGGISIGLTYSRELTENFSMGFNFKYIQERIWHMSAQGFALDVGALYKIDILNEFRLGANISNFGTKMKLTGRDILEVKTVGEGNQGNLINTSIDLDEFSLPLIFRVGVAADLIKSESLRFTLGMDAVHPNDHTEYINAGTEFGWKEIIMFRIGYRSIFERDTEKGLTMGMGFYYRLSSSIKFLFDYAYQDFGRLQNVHYLSLGIKF
ncbi:MAG: PorV/PorQ family protein [Bacteroidota bacterium]